MPQDQRHGRRHGVAASLRDFAAWETLQQVLADIAAARQAVDAGHAQLTLPDPDPDDTSAPGGADRSGGSVPGAVTTGLVTTGLVTTGLVTTGLVTTGLAPPGAATLDTAAPVATSPLRVLDLGGGTGGLAVAIAELGHSVTVVDPNPDALAALVRRAADAGVGERVTAVQGDTETLGELHPDSDVDLVCCHGVLEYVDDPHASLQSIAAVLAPGGYLSLVVAQRMAAVLARAIAGQFAQARQALVSVDGRWGADDPLPRRFDAIGIGDLVRSAGMVVEDSRGIRVFSDLVPSTHLDSEAGRAALLDLEREASRQGEVLGQLGAAVHLLARRD